MDRVWRRAESGVVEGLQERPIPLRLQLQQTPSLVLRLLSAPTGCRRLRLLSNIANL